LSAEGSLLEAKLARTAKGQCEDDNEDDNNGDGNILRYLKVRSNA